MKCSLSILIFLKKFLVFTILLSLLFSSISLHCSVWKAFLSLLTILCLSAFRLVYLSFSPLQYTMDYYSAIKKNSFESVLMRWMKLEPLIQSASLLFSAIFKAPQRKFFSFLHFFLFGMILITACCTMLWTSIHSSIIILNSIFLT